MIEDKEAEVPLLMYLSSIFLQGLSTVMKI